MEQLRRPLSHRPGDACAFTNRSDEIRGRFDENSISPSIPVSLVVLAVRVPVESGESMRSCPAGAGGTDDELES